MSKHNPRSNTKAIKLFQAYMAAKGTPVANPVDVVKGTWWPGVTDKVCGHYRGNPSCIVCNDTKKVGK